MSRIGKKIINIPSGVTVQVNSDVVTVSGPKGTLSTKIQPFISVEINEGLVNILVKEENNKYQRAIWGTSRAIIANMVTGVTEEFTRKLELNGVGFKMELGNELKLALGFSHPVIITIPPSIKLTLEKNVLTAVSIDKHILGDFIMSIHNMKPCDPYKQKGFKIPGRFYRQKVGKSK